METVLFFASIPVVLFDLVEQGQVAGRAVVVIPE
jgi:hypothetical protein